MNAAGFQTTTSSTRAVDQVSGDQLSGLLRRELGERQNGLQQFAHISSRKRGERCDFQLVRQFGVAGVGLAPVEFGLCDKPQGGGGQCEVMLPSAIFLCLELVPTEFKFGILKRTFDKVTLTTSFNQLLGWRFGR